MAKQKRDEHLEDSELFDPSGIEWTMLRTKNLCRITMVAKSETPINAMQLYLSLENQLERWRLELGIMDTAPEIQ